MAESTINVNAPIDQNTPMRELNSTMNYLVAQTATGINLNKKISGQISSLSMNVGKVISTTNGVIREISLSNQKIDSLSNKMGNIDNSIKELIGVVRDGKGTEKTNRSIGNLSQRVTALVNRQDELNKTLQSYFTANKKNEYDALEGKLEQRNDMLSDSLKDMTESLVSIDKTLKQILEKNNIVGGGGGGDPDIDIPRLPKGTGGRIAAAISSIVTFGGLLSAGLGSTVLGLAALGGAGGYIAGQKTAREQSEAAKNAMDQIRGTDNDVAINNPRAVGAGTYRPGRSPAEKEYAANKLKFEEKAANSNGPAFEKTGRESNSLNTTAIDMAVAADVINRNYNKKFPVSKQETKSVSVQPAASVVSNETIPIAAALPNTDIKEKEPVVTAAAAPVTRRSTMPYFPRVGSADIPVGSFNTRDVLEAQQAEIENKAKGITSSDMLYEAADVIYKASTIRFEASNIQFLGALGAAGAGGMMGGMSSTNGPYGNGGGPGNSFNQGGNGDVGPIGAARLTPEQKTAIETLEKTGKYVPGASETTALASLTKDQLSAMGITRTEGRGAGGQTEYSYDAEANKNKDFLPKEARALLDTISAPGLEGADYNTIVGGGKFSEYGQHPGRVGVVTAQGPSTAAGRYQITGTTWKELQDKYSDLKDFSPENQDKAAWYLAQERYSKATGGRKLEEDLKSNDPNIIQGISQALSGTWSSLQGGVHQGSGAGKFSKMYSENLQNGSKGPRGTLADQVGNAQPDKVVAATPGGAKVKEAYGPRRPGRANESIRNIGQVAATAAGMENITYTSGKGNWNSSYVKPGGKTMHSTGNAVDAVGFESEEQKIAFVENAVAAGANGIGVYGDGSVHIDTGEFRSWAMAKNKKYQDAIKRGMERRKKGDIPGADGQIAEAAKTAPSIAEESKKPYTPKPRPKPDAEVVATDKSGVKEDLSIDPPLTSVINYSRPTDAVIETNSTKAAASVVRTETLKQEETRVNDGKADQRKRENDRITQSIQNRESSGPKNPKVEKKELRDVLRSHRNWYDDYWVSRV